MGITRIREVRVLRRIGCALQLSRAFAVGCGSIRGGIIGEDLGKTIESLAIMLTATTFCGSGIAARSAANRGHERQRLSP